MGRCHREEAPAAGIVSLPAAEYDFIGHPYAQRLERPDAYSHESGISIDGWAVAGDGQRQWLAHCYATIGVARDASPDTGTGAELFMPLGGSARRLDRNYTVVGCRPLRGRPSSLPCRAAGLQWAFMRRRRKERRLFGCAWRQICRRSNVLTISTGRRSPPRLRRILPVVSARHPWFLPAESMFAMCRWRFARHNNRSNPTEVFMSARNRPRGWRRLRQRCAAACKRSRARSRPISGRNRFMSGPWSRPVSA